MRENMQFLTMLHQAMRDEKMAADYYEHLLKIAPHECKPHIKHMMEDEEKHYEMLAHIYHMITGMRPMMEDHHAEMPATFHEGLHEAFNDEIEAMEHYRTMYLMTYDMKLRDALFEIMTDEMEHAMRLNHCCCMVMMHKPEMPPMPPMPPLPPPHMPPPPFPKPPKG